MHLLLWVLELVLDLNPTLFLFDRTLRWKKELTHTNCHLRIKIRKIYAYPMHHKNSYSDILLEGKDFAKNMLVCINQCYVKDTPNAF